MLGDVDAGLRGGKALAGGSLKPRSTAGTCFATLLECRKGPAMN
jgi:hypothetical protein